jgi:hypothetical protein
MRREHEDAKVGVVEGWIRDAFGADALVPARDSDRPFSPTELCALAADPLRRSEFFPRTECPRRPRVTRIARRLGGGIRPTLRLVDWAMEPGGRAQPL